MYKQVKSPRFAVCIRIVELVLLTSLTSAEHLLIHKHWTINCAIVLYCIVSIYLPAPSASHSRSLSFTLRSSNPCALFHHNSDYCLSLYSGLPSVRLANLSRVLRSAAGLIGQIPKFGHVSSYMLEFLHWLPIRQRIEYRVASMVWRLAMSIGPRSDLPNRPLSTCIGFSK